MHWSEGNRTIEISDWCYETPEPLIPDPVASWPSDVANALLRLGFECTETGRGAAARRPSVMACIEKVNGMAELPPELVVVDPLIRECVICLDGARGYRQFMPCQHAVCCTECTTMIMAKDEALCPICSQRIEIVQEGHFPNTYQ